jgi:hypothetical protein
MALVVTDVSTRPGSSAIRESGSEAWQHQLGQMLLGCGGLKPPMHRGLEAEAEAKPERSVKRCLIGRVAIDVSEPLGVRVLGSCCCQIY